MEDLRDDNTPNRVSIGPTKFTIGPTKESQGNVRPPTTESR